MGGKPRPKRNKVEVVEGFYGIALYVNDVRIAGQKPYRARVAAVWFVPDDRINSALEEK